MTKKTRHILVLFCALVGVFALTAAPALAKEIHVQTGSFGSAGSGPGQLKEPQGVAVNDETGDVYVVDKGNSRVEQFSSSGAFIAQFDGSAAPAGALEKPTWVAVDNDASSLSHGDVYVTGEVRVGGKARDLIYKFEADGTYLGQLTGTCENTGETPPTCSGFAEFTELFGVAVDPAGELWVYQSGDRVDSYSDALANEFLAQRPVQAPSLACCGELLPGFAVGPGVGPEDNFYTNIVFTGKPAFFERFNSAGEYVSSPGEYGTTAAAVNPSSNELYLDNATSVLAIDASDETQIESFGSGDLSSGTGVAVNSSTGNASSNSVYVADGAADRVVSFEFVAVPATSTEPPAPVGKIEATLHGTVNPEGVAVTSCAFEYGTKPGVFTKTIECSPKTPYTGTANVPVEATLSEATSNKLAADTTYYYRLTASSANGVPNPAPEEHFSTLPAVDALSTGSAEEVTPNTAKLTGTLSPDGTDAHYYFEYGTRTTPVTRCREEAGCFISPALPGTDAGEASEAKHAETNLAGLTASTTYHFRLVAVNSFGTTYGQDVEFKTPAAVEAVSTGPAGEVTGNTAKLTGSLSPDGTDAHYYFQYGVEPGIYSASFPAPPGTDAGTGGTECVPPGGPPKCSAVAAATVVSGLAGNTAYHYRLVAVNAFGTTYGSEQTLTTEITPVIAAAEAKEVSASTWDLRATVNPEGLGLHSCKFEYGTSTAYEHTINCEQTKKQIGEGTAPVPVSRALSELEPNTTYHWRLVVSDAHGSSLGSEGSEDHTFVYSIGGSELPDHRAYEMVTPPFKNGALFGSIFFGKPLAAIAESGSRVIATTIQCFNPAESCNSTRSGAASGEPFEFTRTPTGWVTSALAPPATRFSSNSWFEYGVNEGNALFVMPTGPAGEEEFHLRSAGGSFTPIGPATPPGITGAETYTNVNSAATADLSHFVWEYRTEGRAGAHFWPFDKTELGHESLYEYAGAPNKQPFLVGVTGPPGSTELIGTCGTRLGSATGYENANMWNALSADGRTVYFTAEIKITNGSEFSPCPGGSGANEHIPVPVDELYARVDGEEAGAHTVSISQPDAPQASSSTPVDENCTSEECEKDIAEPANWRDAEFVGASADGSQVFFTSEQQLTNEATQGVGGASGCSSTSECNLYEYDADEPAGRNLIDVSAPEARGEGGGGPRVQGVTLAISADGSHVYFVAQGVLTSISNGQGQSAEPGHDNLYLYERDASFPDGRLAFVTTLSATDNALWGIGDGTTNVTPDGRFLVFQSEGRLTPDDTGGGLQVFRYDAESGELARISIGEDGFDDDGNTDADARIVEPEPFQLGPPRGDPTMSNDGSYVFFQSPAALTPHALNYVVIGHLGALTQYAENVYEWHEGHVYLISDGHDAGSANIGACGAHKDGSAVCLLGTDATGHNVFFTTADQLVPKDTDTQVDIYDARICEPANGNPCITEPAPPLPPCNEEACHGTPEATPSLLAPGSATFNGEGNIAPAAPAPAVKPKALTKAQKLAAALKVCKKDKSKAKRKSCEASAQKKYGSAKKSSKKKGK